VRALLDEKRKPDADQATVAAAVLLARPHLGEPDGLDRAPQALGMIAAVEMLSDHVVERHLLRANHVAQPQLVRLETRLARDRVHDHFDGKANAGAGDAAIRQGRAFVGGDRSRAAAIAGQHIGAREQVRDLRRLQCRRDRVGGIGARIHGCDAVDAKELSLARGVCGDAIVMLPAIGVGGQVLAAILDPAHGMIDTQSQRRERDLFAAEHALVAEAAADVGRDDADVAVVEAQALAQPGLHRMGELRGGDDGEQPQTRIAIGEDAAPFHRQHAVARGADLARDRDVRRLGHLRHPAGVLGERDEDVVLPAFVHERRARLLGGKHVGHRRELVVVDTHPARDVLGFRARPRHAHGDDLAHEAQLVGRQDRLGRDLEPAQRRIGRDRLDAGKVLRGDDRVLELVRHRHAAQAGMRDRAAHERHVAGPGHADVGDVLPLPAQEPLILLAQDRDSDSMLDSGHVSGPRSFRRFSPARIERATTSPQLAH
jgi:hypothetical protein